MKHVKLEPLNNNFLQFTACYATATEMFLTTYPTIEMSLL